MHTNKTDAKCIFSHEAIPFDLELRHFHQEFKLCHAKAGKHGGQLFRHEWDLWLHHFALFSFGDILHVSISFLQCKLPSGIKVENRMRDALITRVAVPIKIYPMRRGAVRRSTVFGFVSDDESAKEHIRESVVPHNASI